MYSESLNACGLLYSHTDELKVVKLVPFLLQESLLDINNEKLNVIEGRGGILLGPNIETPAKLKGIENLGINDHFTFLQA